MHAQTVQIGSLEDQQLRLLSIMDKGVPFTGTGRPFRYDHYSRVFDSDEPYTIPFLSPLHHTKIALPGGLHLRLLPATFRTTLNTRFPHSENNMAAWYGRGVNGEFSGGASIAHRYFTLSLQPHLIYQQNKDFKLPNFVRRPDGSVEYRYPASTVQLDAPFRFGPDPFTTFDWGNSSLRIHAGFIEAGLSSEPQWWGPSNLYPLVMSNNAPGLHHFFISTREGLAIPYFGTIHFRWMIGSPEQTEWFDRAGADEKRFLNAANLSYQPAFFPSLTLGFTRVYQLYLNERVRLDDITVIFGPLQKVTLIAAQGGDGERQVRNQLLSVYFHLQLAEARAELYGEFYRDDHSFDLRDLLNQPHHNSAYSFGFKKLFDGPFADLFSVTLEFTNLTTSQLKQVRPQAYFYTHSLIQQGHTHRGQLLGAAIGPGSNSQFLSLDLYKNHTSAGFFIQRVTLNDNFHFEQGSAGLLPGSRSFGDYFRHRINLIAGNRLLHRMGNVYVESRLLWVKAYNYGRYDYGRIDGFNLVNYERNDRSNVQFQIGITYVF